MAGRIPRQFIDDLLNRVDIVDVVDSRVALKKKGKEYTACCPFHGEKTPSFTVSQQKQFYHCFGCGAHGTALSFIMEYERLDFVDAVETLAADYQLEVPREAGNFSAQNKDDKLALYSKLEQASDVYASQLKSSERAIDYLKKRGLSGDIAKTFGIGYSPDSWDFILKQLGKSAEDIKHLLKAGLLIEKSANKQYDRFRDRIMFPIRDRRGRVIGFGGRILDQGEPKYLNSPETPVFHKGSELYGLYEARQAVRNLARIVIVEGYMDVVALAQHGVPYAVATLGTATSSEQISRLFRVVPEIIFCYDGDAAGKKAAWRALENSLPVLHDGVQARFLFLPDGEDPDSLIRQEGQHSFEERLKTATPLSDFLLDHLSEPLDLSSIDGCARLSDQAKPLIAKLSNGVFKNLLSKQLAERIGMPTQGIQQAARPYQQNSTSRKKAGRYEIQVTPIRLAIALLIQYPDLCKERSLPTELQQLDMPGLKLLLELHSTISSSQNYNASALLERWRDKPDAAALNKLMQMDIPGSDDIKQRKQAFDDALDKLMQHYKKQRIEFLLRKGDLDEAEKTELSELYMQPIANTNTPVS